jgi:hypothetical protein
MTSTKPAQRVCVAFGHSLEPSTVLNALPTDEQMQEAKDIVERRKPTKKKVDTLMKQDPSLSKEMHSEAKVEQEAKKIAVRRASFARHDVRPENVLTRPTLMGNNYVVPAFARGHWAANPWPVSKDVPLEVSLANFKVYLAARLDSEDLNGLQQRMAVQGVFFPDSMASYLATPTATKFDYLCLRGTEALFGDTFRNALESLRGCNLGCFCQVGNPCHVDIVMQALYGFL